MDESLRCALDYDLVLRFVDAGAKIVRLNRYLGAFREHEAQKTARLRDRSEEEVARLHARVHGRAPSQDEIARRLAPHLRRQARHRRAHRVLRLLPGPRMTPAWLRG